MILTFRPLRPGLLDCMGQVVRGSWGSSCWCMYPRLGSAEAPRIGGQARREAMTSLARCKRAPGLMAFESDEPVGGLLSRRGPSADVEERVVDLSLPGLKANSRKSGSGCAFTHMRISDSQAA